MRAKTCGWKYNPPRRHRRGSQSSGGSTRRRNDSQLCPSRRCNPATSWSTTTAARRPSSESAWQPAPLSQHRSTGLPAEATPGARASIVSIAAIADFTTHDHVTATSMARPRRRAHRRLRRFMAAAMAASHGRRRRFTDRLPICRRRRRRTARPRPNFPLPRLTARPDAHGPIHGRRPWPDRPTSTTTSLQAPLPRRRRRRPWRRHRPGLAVDDARRRRPLRRRCPNIYCPGLPVSSAWRCPRVQ